MDPKKPRISVDRVTALGEAQGSKASISQGPKGKAGAEEVLRDGVVRDEIISDEALVGALAAGDLEAGEALIDRYHEPLLRYLNRLTGSASISEDIVQQTWLSVVEHSRQFKPTKARLVKGRTGVDEVSRQPDAVPRLPSFKAWLYRIATNKVHDVWRSKAREKRAHQGVSVLASDETPDARERMDITEQQLQVRRAIDKLPDAQKQVVLLRYYSGLSFAEIARMLGCPLNTALGRMHKAVQKLRFALTLQESPPV